MKLLDRFQEITSFWDATKFVKNKEIVQLVSSLLVNNDVSIKPEILLSAYLIHLYPDDILSSDRNALENYIFTKSTEVVEIVENKDLQTHREILLSYVKIFNDWKSKDATSQLNIYLEMYVSYKNMSTVDCKEKTDLLEKLYKSISMLSNNNAEHLIEEFESSLRNDIRDSAIVIHNQIEKQMKNAYWDRIIETGINHDIVLEWLSDVKELFVEIYHQYKYSSGEIRLLHEYIDIDFIKPQIEHFDTQKLFHWICDKAKELDASSFDNEYIQIHKYIDEGEHIKAVRFIFERLEDIRNFSVNTNNN